MESSNDTHKRREQVAYEFELQSQRLQFSIVATLRNYRYKLFDERHMREVVAIVLPESFDYYRLRLNHGKHRIDMLIVERHNAMLPIRCVSMEESHEYAAHSLPRTSRPTIKRRNTEEANLFVSQLILGVKKAYAELEQMPLRTQQRYLQKRDSYLRPRVGRPWAS